VVEGGVVERETVVVSGKESAIALVVSCLAFRFVLTIPVLKNKIFGYGFIYCTGTKLTDRDNDREHIICPVMTTPHIFNYLNIN